jgi:hypothetical protein
MVVGSVATFMFRVDSEDSGSLYLSSVDNIAHNHTLKQAKKRINIKLYVLPMQIQYGYSSITFAMHRSNLKYEYEKLYRMGYNAV